MYTKYVYTDTVYHLYTDIAAVMQYAVTTEPPFQEVCMTKIICGLVGWLRRNVTKVTNF